MKKRFISLILALAVLTGLLAGCGSKADAPATNAPAVEATGEKITVILPRHEMDTIGFYEEKTREFEAQTGIKVELILMIWDQVADRRSGCRRRYLRCDRAGQLLGGEVRQQRLDCPAERLHHR